MFRNNSFKKNNFSILLKAARNDKKQLINNIKNIQQIATIEAIQTAAEKTPPQDGDIRGTGTITGTLKSAWARDSLVESKKRNGKYITVLANNEYYASFVNDGHRMDKHFVPGLIINPYSGLLEKAPPGMEGGIMVGTKTKYVVGKYMKEAALVKYYNSLNEQAEQLVNNLELNK